MAIGHLPSLGHYLLAQLIINFGSKLKINLDKSGNSTLKTNNLERTHNIVIELIFHFSEKYKE